MTGVPEMAGRCGTVRSVFGGGVTVLFILHVLITAVVARPTESSLAFTILTNVSLPCSELTHSPEDDAPLTPSALSQDELLQLLVQQGGTFSPTFMARTAAEASQALPPLLSLPPEDQARILAATGRGRVYKADVVRYLQQAAPADPGQAEADVNRQEAGTETLMLPSEETGGGDKVAFCLARGQLLPDQLHLRLCTVCNTLMELDESTWPRFINEARCMESDSSCLMVNDQPHGKCLEPVMPLNVLRRQPDQCVVRLKDGRALVAEHWALSSISVRVGCQCAIDSRSWMAGFVN